MKRFITLICVLSICICMISGCKRNEITKEDTYVKEDASYFSSNVISAGEDYLESTEYDNVSLSVSMYTDEYFVVEAICDSYDNEGFCTTNVFFDKYSYSGDILGHVSLDSEYISRDHVLFLDQNSVYDLMIMPTGESNDFVVCELNFEEATFIETNAFSIDAFDNTSSMLSANKCDEGILLVYQNANSTGVTLVDNDGTQVWNQELDIFCIDVKKTDDELLLYVDNDGIYNFSISNRTINKYDVTEELFNKYCKNSTIGNNKEAFSMVSNRIDKLDLDTMTESTYVDFNYCDLSLYTLSNCFVEYVSDNRIVMEDLAILPSDNINRLRVVTLQKEDTNPYSGRPIIEVAQLWGVNPVMGAGILDYNRTQSTCFAYVSSRYNEDFVVPEIYGEDLTFTELSQMIISQLMLDINTGVGPDVVIGLGDVEQINNSDYLMDFNEYISNDDSFDKELYFTNILSAYENSNGLFQIPLEASAFGVMTRSDNVSDNSVGFNYADYYDFVSNINNGSDPIAIDNTRDRYFEFLYANNEDSFFEDGNPNFDCEEFRELAEYVKENIPEEGLPISKQPSSSNWVVMSGFYFDIQQAPFTYDSWNIYGAPSSDARGLMLCVFNTVAITSTTSNSDESWNLVKSLLGETAQRNAQNNPININAFYGYAGEAVEIINRTNEQYGLMVDELTQDDIDRYYEMLTRIDHSNAIDSEVYSIVIEELQPYFADSKTIDEVIEIINDRASTIVQERE